VSDKDIDIDQISGSIICSPDGGNVAVVLHDKIKWKRVNKVVAFRLTFRIVPVSGLPTPSAPWPFGDDPPPAQGDNSTGWVAEFSGRVALQGVFDYTTETKTLTAQASMDPMIIVGK
jgi:hypothetical protein